MLEALRIRDLGVIEDVEVEFVPGLCVVTGETGAGKTMVVTGLQLLFGGRADASRVRAGAEQANVEGRVRVAAGSAAAERALDAGAELDDGELLLRRTVTTAGRSRAQLGGTSVPVGVLGAVGADLFVVHGQADQIRLADAVAQRRALDRSAGVDLTAYRAALARWRAAEQDLAERTTDRGALLREADLLSFGVTEIEAAGPSRGEDVELHALAARLGAADELRLAARVAHDALLGDADDPTADAQDTRSLLALAHRQLRAVADNDEQVAGLAERIGELAVHASELGAELAAYGNGLDADPARLAATEARRAELSRLIRKYAGATIDDVLDWAERARVRLADIDTSDEALDRLAQRRDSAADALRARAAAVTAARVAAADTLSRDVTAELQGLAMAHARLIVAVRPRQAGAGVPTVVTADGTPAGAGADGVDEVEFLLSPGLDSPALPLARGASGGELSRVMLALEVVLAGSDPVPVMVFDEVDAGVGGRAAVEVGRRLARLARGHQVIVVTHLAQVAAFADLHLVVGNVVGSVVGTVVGSRGGERVRGSAAAGHRSAVTRVDGEDRLAELARMLAGRDTGAAREHAAELLADARAERQSSMIGADTVDRSG